MTAVVRGRDDERDDWCLMITSRDYHQQMVTDYTGYYIISSLSDCRNIDRSISQLKSSLVVGPTFTKPPQITE